MSCFGFLADLTDEEQVLANDQHLRKRPLRLGVFHGILFDFTGRDGFTQFRSKRKIGRTRFKMILP